MSTMKSARLFGHAQRLLPGGVSSPVRAFSPYPVYIESAKGCMLRDVDGNEYIDYCMGFGPMILGHARREVVDALKFQAEMGVLYGAPIESEVEMAELISSHYPGMEMMRFVSSGTEATMHALRLARGATGRKKIIKVEGAFHGAHDSVLVRAGSGATTHSAPNSLGVLSEVAANTLLVPYNDLNAVERVLSTHRDEVAALIAEPVMGNIGPILPHEGYLQRLRELCDRHGALLIFDEVITGFRLAMGGAQQYYGVKADITTLGKIAGGGMPIGIFGGLRETMSRISPLGKVYQAGTYGGNPMSLAAGLATLRVLEREGHEGLASAGEIMRRGLEAICADGYMGCRVQGIGSMFQLFFTSAEVRDYSSALRCDGDQFMRLFHALLDEGVYLPPSQWETCFLSTAHDQGAVRKTLSAFEAALSKVVG